MGIAFKFSAFEIEAVKSWYEYVSGRSLLLNVKDLCLQSELEIIRKLETYVDKKVSFTETEVAVMRDWMERAVAGKYGSEDVLMGYELRAFRKLRSGEEGDETAVVSVDHASDF